MKELKRINTARYSRKRLMLIRQLNARLLSQDSIFKRGTCWPNLSKIKEQLRIRKENQILKDELNKLRQDLKEEIRKIKETLDKSNTLV